MDLIDRGEIKRGTRSESREGTRWMGKHVGVDFVDQPIRPSTTSNSRLVLLLLPPLLLAIRLPIAHTS